MPPRSPRHTLTVATAFPPGSWLERGEHLVAIGGPIGFIPWVPATWASLAAALVCFALGRAGHLSPVGIVVAGAVLVLVGVRTAGTAERLLQSEDPRNVVIDELAGQTLTFVWALAPDWRTALAGFVLFRIFDIWKPFPARRLEALHGGLGIMADDVMAGLYAALVLGLLARWLH